MYVHNSWLYLKPELRDGYVERLLEEVRHAKKVEKAVLRFDVYESLDDPSLIHTYEVFTDREAWEFHHDQTYLKEFQKATRHMFDQEKQKTRRTIECRTIVPADDVWEAVRAERG
jgi:quinol monooxygenase YgiN